MVENLINDLLDLAKMEQSTFKFNNSYFDLSQVIYQALTMVITSATSNGVRLKAKIGNSRDLDALKNVYGDENRFMQILLNFLTNSIKFTNREGIVTVYLDVLECQNLEQ